VVTRRVVHVVPERILEHRMEEPPLLPEELLRRHPVPHHIPVVPALQALRGPVDGEGLGACAAECPTVRIPDESALDQGVARQSAWVWAGRSRGWRRAVSLDLSAQLETGRNYCPPPSSSSSELWAQVLQGP